MSIPDKTWTTNRKWLEYFGTKWAIVTTCTQQTGTHDNIEATNG